jgi:hypothetical protein
MHFVSVEVYECSLYCIKIYLDTYIVSRYNIVSRYKSILYLIHILYQDVSLYYIKIYLDTIYARTNTHTNIHAYKHTLIQLIIDLCPCMYTHMHTCIQTHTSRLSCFSLFFVNTCMHTYIQYIHTQTHTHQHRAACTLSNTYAVIHTYTHTHAYRVAYVSIWVVQKRRERALFFGQDSFFGRGMILNRCVKVKIITCLYKTRFLVVA